MSNNVVRAGGSISINIAIVGRYIGSIVVKAAVVFTNAVPTSMHF